MRKKILNLAIFIQSISNIFNDIVYFLFKKLTTVNFNTHFHAYEINFTDQWYYLKFQDLVVHTATNIRITANSKRLVPFCLLFIDFSRKYVFYNFYCNIIVLYILCICRKHNICNISAI